MKNGFSLALIESLQSALEVVSVDYCSGRRRRKLASVLEAIDWNSTKWQQRRKGDSKKLTASFHKKLLTNFLSTSGFKRRRFFVDCLWKGSISIAIVSKWNSVFRLFGCDECFGFIFIEHSRSWNESTTWRFHGKSQCIICTGAPNSIP